jgi:hypothetical protein
MASITIHDLDEHVATLLRERARRDGTSLNKTIKRLLEGALGVRPVAAAHRKDFEKFCGVWSKAQAAEFSRATAELDEVDPRDWR